MSFLRSHEKTMAVGGRGNLTARLIAELGEEGIIETENMATIATKYLGFDGEEVANIKAKNANNIQAFHCAIFTKWTRKNYKPSLSKCQSSRLVSESCRFCFEFSR